MIVKLFLPELYEWILYTLEIFEFGTLLSFIKRKVASDKSNESKVKEIDRSHAFHLHTRSYNNQWKQKLSERLSDRFSNGWRKWRCAFRTSGHKWKQYSMIGPTVVKNTSGWQIMTVDTTPADHWKAAFQAEFRHLSSELSSEILSKFFDKCIFHQPIPFLL